MKRYILLSLALCLGNSVLKAGPLSADNDTTKTKRRVLTVYANVTDHLTHEGIDSLRATLLRAADSTFVDTVHVDGYTSNNRRTTYVTMAIREAGSYLLRLEADGYQTRYAPIDIPKLYKRELYQELKPIYMRKKRPAQPLPSVTGGEGDGSVTTMQEIVVKATKLKFYMDGDTLVYDADAFSLAEGSMLDALIKKLPGVELHSGGEITVNGRKVDALLLNGKDFFNSDRELLLENMPSYMVKSIRSYERTPDEVKGTIREKTTPKEMVMDVRLKKDYNTAWLANAEGGVGTTLASSEKKSIEAPSGAVWDAGLPFLARTFAMRYTTKSRIALFANANNLSDYRTPGEKGEWSPLTQSQGLTTSYTDGGNGMYEPDESLRYQGSVNGSYMEKNDAQHTSRETFLTGGNTYGRSFWNQRSYDYNLKTDHSLRLRHPGSLWNALKGLYFSYNPSLRYMHWSNHSESASTTLDADVAAGWGKAWMDSLMTPNAGGLLRRYALNRTISRLRGSGHWLSWKNNGYFNVSPAHNDFIDFSIDFNHEFTDRHEDTFEHYRLDYPKTDDAADFRNRYRPAIDRTNRINVEPELSITLDSKHHHSLGLAYEYSYHDVESSKSLYLLNQLEKWAKPEAQTLGLLPSTEELMRTLDADNSYRSHGTTVTHSPKLGYNFSLYRDSIGTWNYFSVSLSLPVRRETMNYWQGTQIDTIVSRCNTGLSARLSFRHDHRKTDRMVYAYYSTNVTQPPIRSMLNIHNDSNPLYIYNGNPDLRPSRDHSLYASYREKLRRTLVNASAYFNATQDAIASSVLYDMSTGVRTVTPQNINGNWNVLTSAAADFPLVRDERLRLKQKLSHSYNHSVDLMNGSRSTVASHNLDDELSLTWRPTDKLDFTAKGDLHYQHSTSEREDFLSINVFDFDYGLAAQVELPWNFQISTDLTMYSRRGYSDATMNTNELVWNARLTKRLMHGNLLLQLDGFDILGNLSNVRRFINAQGRTETFYNVIPSYALLHLTWRLNKKPKKD